MTTENRNRNGYALIVVLSTLSIIALLIASSTTRLLSRVMEIDTEERIGQVFQERAALVQLALDIYGDAEGRAPNTARFAVPWLGDEAELYLQDVGGLIDLNTAGVEVMDALARGIGIPQAALQRYRDWQLAPNRLQTVSDFGRVTGLDRNITAQLQSIATVHSGLIGIAPELAPTALLNALGQDRDSFRDDWRSAPTALVFEVRLNTDEGMQILGIISMQTGLSQSAVLSLR